jgi:hypothetical protein
MRSVALLLVCLAASFISHGQKQASTDLEKLQKELSSIYKKHPPAKTTNTASRVKSYLVEIYNGTSFINYDSMLYQWSGQHGGDLTHYPMKYDSYNMVQWNTSISMWQGLTQALQTFDANDNIASTTYKIWNGGVWDNSNRSLFSSYDANNNNLLSTNQTWNNASSSWDNSSKYTNTYTNNMPDVSIGESWTGSSWVNFDKLTYSYLPNGDLDYFIRQSWDGATSSWVNTDRNLFSYDASGDQIEELVQVWDAGTSAWKNNSRNVYTNVNHLPSSIIEQLWNSSTNSYVSSMRRTYTYNSYGQILTRVMDSWDAGANTWTTQTGNTKFTIHYEEYTTGINDISNGGEFKLYPSPAKNMANISLNWNVQQSFSIAVYDLQGRVIKYWDEAPVKEYRCPINTSELPAGSYYVRIQGERGSMIKPLLVLH